MQAYMKSQMPYRGVPAPLQRSIFRPIFDADRLDQQGWRNAVLRLWREARYREERYAAIELTGHRYYAEFQNLSMLSVYEEMIVSGAWWDFVDTVAIRRVGGLLLRKYPKALTRRLMSWSRSPDLWKRRSAIIAQVSFKTETDLDLLYYCIENNLDDREFFITKAIGWALRSYSWVDPKEVERYVKERSGNLSGLSEREALKRVRKG